VCRMLFGFHYRANQEIVADAVTYDRCLGNLEGDRLTTIGKSKLLVKNLSTLSTSAPAPSVRVDRKVFRRGTCDRGIWTKSLAFAADAEELIFLYGFSMAVSLFARPRSPQRKIVESWGAAQ
jgi:hypothetical protein